MKRLLNKDYLISLGYSPIKIDDFNFLVKEYVAVQLHNENDEIIDLIEITVYLEEKEGKWYVKHCFKENIKEINLFNSFYKTGSMKELIYFDMIHSK